MTDECRRFDESLVDLCYGELTDDVAEPLREHASRCPRCRGELEGMLLLRKLARRLPEPEAPSGIDSAILEAARQRAAELSPRPEPGFVPIVPGPRLIDQIRHVFLRPALAFSALTALIAIGALAVIHLSSKDPMATDAPAVVASQDAELDQPSPAVAPSPVDEAEAERIVELAEQAELSAGAPARLGTSFGPVSPPRPAPSTAPKVASLPRKQLDAGGDSPKKEERRDLPSSHASALDSATATRDTEWSTARLERALAAYLRGDCQSARPDLQAVADDRTALEATVATALHHLARCEKRSGSCGKAVPLYARLLRDHPRHRERPAALLEAAQCHHKLGHNGEARGLLVELRRFPEYTAQAEAELARLPND